MSYNYSEKNLAEYNSGVDASFEKMEYSHVISGDKALKENNINHSLRFSNISPVSEKKSQYRLP